MRSADDLNVFVSVDDPQTVERLVTTILSALVDCEARHHQETPVIVNFRLRDGLEVRRALYASDGALRGYIMLPRAPTDLLLGASMARFWASLRNLSACIDSVLNR